MVCQLSHVVKISISDDNSGFTPSTLRREDSVSALSSNPGSRYMGRWMMMFTLLAT